MATKLQGLQLQELSFVTRPANKAARVLIFKHDDTAPNTETTDVFEVAQTSVTTFEKAQANFDALVQKRMREHNESEPTATERISRTLEGRRLYREAMLAHDVEVAKATTLLTYEKRDVEKVGAAVGAWSELDRLAKEHAAKTNQNFHQSYMQIIGTPQGQKLYAAGLTRPSIAGATA
jgi:hypothetical protein